MVTKKYIVENGVGHYEVSNGIRDITCDEGELSEVVRELEEELQL